MDALHTPIQKVKYTGPTHVLDTAPTIDKLTLEIWTDGSLSPEDAVAFVRILQKSKSKIFISFVEEPEPELTEDTTPEEEWNENLFKRVSTSWNCLCVQQTFDSSIEYIWQLVERSVLRC